MPTIANLEADGALIRLDIELDGGEQPWRRVWATPAFISWLGAGLPALTTTIVGGKATPEEQVDAVFAEYVSGANMDLDRRFKKLNPRDRGVWEFKTPDVRIFGWVPCRDGFICAFGAHKDALETFRLYPRFIAQTVFVRTNLELEEPKFIEGQDYGDVVSDANL